MALASLAEEHKKTDAVLRRAIRAGVEEARRQRARTRLLDARTRLLDEKTSAAQRVFDQKLAELAEAQRQTEASLKAFIDSMQRGGNGRH